MFVELVPVEPVVVDLVLETPVLDEVVALPKRRSSCAARAELLEGLTYRAPAEVFTVFEVVDLLLVVFPVLVDPVLDEAVPVARVLVDLVVVDPVLVEPVLVDPVVPSIQRSSCAARAELPVGFTHTKTKLDFLATGGAADT
jgi:hypothetical protein